MQTPQSSKHDTSDDDQLFSSWVWTTIAAV
jgi:hypothetical protein